jgi:hypothetical protein
MAKPAVFEPVIRKALTAAGADGVSIPDLAEQAGCSHQQAYKVIEKLKATGEVEKVEGRKSATGGGLMRLVGAGSADGRGKVTKANKGQGVEGTAAGATAGRLELDRLEVAHSTAPAPVLGEVFEVVELRKHGQAVEFVLEGQSGARVTVTAE